MKIKVFLLYLFTFLMNDYVYADIINSSATGNVFCATRSKNWEWLKKIRSDGKDWEYVTINGQWKVFEMTATPEYSVYVKYFEVDDASTKIKELQNQCINRFGSDYVYTQIANSWYSEWSLMGIETQNLLTKGFSFVIHYNRSNLSSSVIFIELHMN